MKDMMKLHKGMSGIVKDDNNDEKWAMDPISEIFKGRVKQIITFQGADG